MEKHLMGKTCYWYYVYIEYPCLYKYQCYLNKIRKMEMYTCALTKCYRRPNILSLLKKTCEDIKKKDLLLSLGASMVHVSP